jgi:CBS domain-containing protein
MPSIESLMATDMITATPKESVVQVADRMSRNRVGAVLVVEGEALRGIFSERDLVNRVIAMHKNPATTKISEVATQEVVTIDADMPLKEVLAIFRERRFRHLPVVRDGKPVGILSTRDFLEFLVDNLERFIIEKRYIEINAEGGDIYDHFGGGYGR